MIKNGLGPYWFPDWLRKLLSKAGSSFFDEAAWDKHDEGYAKQYPSRVVCDRKFLQAMLKDASKTTTTFRVFMCCILAWVFWFFVRVFGWISYNKKGN